MEPRTRMTSCTLRVSVLHGGRQATLGSFTLCVEMAFDTVMFGLHGCSTGDRFVRVDEFLLVVIPLGRPLRERVKCTRPTRLRVR